MVKRGVKKGGEKGGEKGSNLVVNVLDIVKRREPHIARNNASRRNLVQRAFGRLHLGGLHGRGAREIVPGENSETSEENSEAAVNLGLSVAKTHTGRKTRIHVFVCERGGGR
mgnify:CR=1 FL=1